MSKTKKPVRPPKPVTKPTTTEDAGLDEGSNPKPPLPPPPPPQP